MILGNKMFKLSSLCIIGTIAVAMNQVISSNAQLGRATTMKNDDAKSSNYAKNTGVIVDSSTMSYKTTKQDGKIVVEEETVPTAEQPEEHEEKKEEIREREIVNVYAKGIKYNDDVGEQMCICK